MAVYDTFTDRVVAIQSLACASSRTRNFRPDSEREAHAAARLNDPHVIPIHNYGEIDGRLYVDMRLIEGRDLQTVVGNGPLELTRAVRIIEQVAKALNAAHKIGLVDPRECQTIEHPGRRRRLRLLDRLRDRA